MSIYIRPYLTGLACLLAGTVLGQTRHVGGSPFYEFELVAMPSDTVAGGTGNSYPLLWAWREVAINDHGRVAFTGVMEDGAGEFARVLIADTPAGGLRWLSRAEWDVEHLHFLSFPQINNDSHVVVVSGSLYICQVGCGWDPTCENLYHGGEISVYSAGSGGGETRWVDEELQELPGAPRLQRIRGTPENGTSWPYSYAYASLANDGNMAYLAHESDLCSDTFTNSLNIGVAAVEDSRVFVDEITGWNPPAIADNQTVVVREGEFSDSSILFFRDGETTLALASTSSDFTALHYAPGISSDGQVVAFIGADDNGIEGVYLTILDEAGEFLFSAERVLSSESVIAYDADATPIHLGEFGSTLENWQTEPAGNPARRIAVIRQDVGNDNNIIGDRVLLAFIATPSQASEINPSTGQPFLFSGSAGIWTLSVDIQLELAPPHGQVLNPRGVLPVIQTGDLIDGEPITFLHLWHGLGRGLSHPDGSVRQTVSGAPNPNEHLLAFAAETATGLHVIRAAHFDTDHDGLPDHWERTGGGIDMDRDGVPDLVLSDWGAKYDHKDLFLEADWLAPRTTGVVGSWKAEPFDLTFYRLQSLLANAPVDNPDGESGITLHVDAGTAFNPWNGAPYSINTGAGSLQGGDEISQQGSGASIDVVHFGETFPHPAPGLQTRSFHDIKKTFFGTAEKRARELAFRYVVFADAVKINDDGSGGAYIGQVSHATRNRLQSFLPLPPPPMGRVMVITEGRGAGQVREIDATQTTNLSIRVYPDWEVIPDATSRFVLLLGVSGMGEVFFRDPPNHHSLPGNDLIVSLGAWGRTPDGRFAGVLPQWRTLGHELGHTLGLRHGGTDDCAFKGTNYLSIMSYSHQLRAETNQPVVNRCIPPTNTVSNVPVVQSFSVAGDPTFADWSSIQLSPYDNPTMVGNSFLLGVGPEEQEELSIEQYIEIYERMPDVAPPVIHILEPAAGSNVAPGAALQVLLQVEDDSALDEVQVAFDIDGDGVADGPFESVLATSLGGDLYAAEFSNVSGPDGARVLSIRARDSFDNETFASPKVWVGAGSSGDSRNPTVGINQPPFFGAKPFEAGSWIRVQVSAYDFRDNFSLGVIDRVIVSLDLDGDGTVTGPGETRVAAPVGSDTFEALFPAIGGALSSRTITATAYDDWLNTAQATRSIAVVPLDTQLPLLVVTQPVPGQVYEVGDTMVVHLQASDNQGLDELTVTFDQNGDGLILATCERSTQFLNGQTNVTLAVPINMCFSGQISGPPGLREVITRITDRVGNPTSVVRVVEIVPETIPPSILVTSPPPNSVVGLGLPMTVDMLVTDNVAVQQVTAFFDVDGDGEIGGGAEQAAATWLGASSYRVTFPALSGPTGPRTLRVRAVDSSSNTSLVEQVVRVVEGGDIVDPPALAMIRPSGTFTVELEIVPGLAVSNVWVWLDLDGDGLDSGEGERVAAVLVGGRMWRASFSGLSGDPGVRTLRVEIVDSSLATNTLFRQIHVLTPDHFEGLRSQHLGWAPNLPETASAGIAAGAAPADMVKAGNFLFFTALDGVASRELWRTDGSARGTRMVGQVAKEGGPDELRGSGIRNLIAYDGLAYFRATDDVYGLFEYKPPGLVGAEFWTTDGSPGRIDLVRDQGWPPGLTNTSPRNANLENAVRFKDRIFYVAFDPDTGRELRSTDGTGAGTTVFDLEPGAVGIGPEHLVVAGDQLFFAARNGTELWKSDGAFEGTVLVRGGFSMNGIRRMIAVGNKVFFNANENVWVSDGTLEGTHLTKQIRIGGVPFPQHLTAWGNILYFSADDGVTGRELWRTDGTTNGTWQVQDLFPGAGSGNPSELTVFHNALYFAANHPVLGRELWMSDGTSNGTQVAVDVAPYTGTTPFGLSYPSKDSNPQHLTAFQDALYFQADDGLGQTGKELYRSDGTPQGTALLRDLQPGVTNITFSQVVPLSSAPEPLLADQDALYFSAATGYRRELWKTDGTAAGTRMVRNLYHAEPRALWPVHEGLFFSASDLAYGREPWVMLSNRVTRLGDFDIGPRNSDPVVFGQIDGDILFAARDGVWPLTFQPSFGLYRTDGTPTGTVKLHAFASLGHALFPPTSLPGNRIVFRAAELNGEEIWVTDGTAPGTRQLADIYPGTFSSSPSYPGLAGGHIYFSALTTGGWTIWKTDGTTNGTVQVADINPGTPDTPSGRFTPLNGAVVFAGFVNTRGLELWKTDGTGPGTELIMEFAPLSSSGLEAALLQPFHVFDNEIYFQAFAGGGSAGLWKSDGTTGGTVQLYAGDPGGWIPGATLFEEFEEAGGQLFFAARGQGVELHRTDGTPDGTLQVRNIVGLNPSGSFEDSSFPRDLTALNGVLLFTAFDYTHGRELWRSDGTLEGTFLVKDILPGYASSRISEMTPLGSILYFAANNDRHGRELWMTDGTTEGTEIVEDLLPGPMSSNPSRLLVHDGRLYYYADSGGDDLGLRLLEPGASAFDAWLDAVPLAGASRGLFADPNNNALPNLYAYLLGLDPLSPGSAIFLASPVGAMQHGSVGYFDVSLTRRREAEALGLEIITEVSTDLFRWRRATHTELSATPLSGNMERVTLRLSSPLAPAPTLFVRFRVRSP